MARITIDRRSFVAGIATGLSVALAGRRLSAQTPQSLIAVTPEELLDTLEHTPINRRFDGMRLSPVAWDDVGKSGYRNAVGGVKIVTEDGDEEVFGGYVIFEDADHVQDAIETVTEEHVDITIASFPKTIEGHEGIFLEFDENEYHSITLIPVRNVLVIGYDTDVRRHHGRGGRGGNHRHRGEDHQSISHAAILVRHLLPILNRQT